MIEFLSNQWEKITSVLVSAIVALVVFYKRFLGVEDQLAQHIRDDQELKKDLKAGVEKIVSMEVKQGQHEVVLSDMREDIREMRQDIKKLLSK